jgi:cytidine deaminase
MSEDDDLVARAVAIQPHAYAPYSRFKVGAAVRFDGKIFEGVNVENATFQSMCAERNAIAAAIAAGARTLEAVAVCTEASPPSSPCGACRQVLAEFAPAQLERVQVIAVNPRGERRTWTLAELLPAAFRANELP